MTEINDAGQYYRMTREGDIRLVEAGPGIGHLNRWKREQALAATQARIDAGLPVLGLFGR